jgi:hypothetical protein
MEGPMKINAASEEYIEKASNLTEEEADRLLSRMRDKLTHRLDEKKLSKLEVLALQLEYDDERLAEWREKRQIINANGKA